MSDFANLNSDVRLVPDGTKPILFHASQYDIGRIFNVHVIDDGEDWAIPGGASAVLNAVKPDGNVYTADLSTTSSYAQIVTDEQLTAVAGSVLCEVRFTLPSGEDLGTANFVIAVEASPLEGGAVSESVLGTVQSAIAELQSALENLDVEAAIEAYLTENEIEVSGATVTVGTTTTGDAGTEASVTNSGTDTDVILDFVIPRGADGADGADGAAGADGSDGVGISSMAQTASSTESGGTNTWTATLTDGTAYSFNVLNGAQGETGATGATGATGETGAAGADGADGASAYDYAVDGGYTGTETEFATLMATIVALIDAEEASY